MTRIPSSPRGRTALLAAACVLLASCPLWAAPLKIDISNSGRPISEGLDPAFTNWGGAVQNWFTGGNTTSATFGGVTVTFTRVGPNGTALKTGYWKDGVQSTAYNVKLTGDGILVDGGEAGAQIEMRIAGLSPGSHSLLLYLNSWDGTAAPNVAPLDIFVGDPQTQVFDNLPVSVRVTDNNLATTAYFPVTAVAGQDVVVLVKAETSGSHTSKNVHINGFEIDVPNAKAQANNPAPAHADEHANADTGSLTLSWGTAVLGATSHDVYLGTSESAVADATPASPEFRGNQTANSYLAGGINPHLTYYWRVDEVTATGSTKGNVWMFRPRRLAFPGAEGYGRFARGGRGGVVVKVTNLNDSGPGSLRDAITGDYGPRTVIFDVSGLIDLQSPDIIIGGTRPYITIAGQTAPGKGVTIKRQQLAMSGSRDVIFRYLRLLVGKESGETQNATGMAGADHCIMDHVSAGWGIDEGLSTRGGKNLTFQRNNLSEALNIAGHQNYGAGTRHGYAASIGGDIASFHHNLLAHNEGRNWSMAGGLDGAGYYAGKLDIFNNVVYNWRGRTTDGGAHQVNFVNNFYKRGPANGITTLLNPQYGGFPGTQQYYMSGNILLNGSTTVTNQTSLLNIGTESGGTLPQNSNPPYSATVASPFFPSHATIHTATNAYKQVLSDVGCNLPQIDNRDTRIIGETIAGNHTYTGSVSGTPGLPDTTADVGGWENYGNETRPAGFDTDNDGLPDWWESIKGLSNASPAGDYAECNADPDGDGYTNLEDYLNWMAAPNFAVNAGASVDVDLHALARGYLATTPVFTLSEQTNGSVALVGNRYARFTPSGSDAALGGFTFTVTDSAGDSMTRSVGVRIVGAAVVLPEVTLAASDASAGESGSDQQLRFTVTRTGSTAASLSVPLVASGSATSGADYSGFASPVTIPAGQASADLALAVLPDDAAEGSETVTLTLGADPAFTAGSPSSASASIADKPSQAYYAAVIADPARRGPLDDPDGDSVPNLLEYFTGSNPASGSGGGSIVVPSAAPTPNTFKVSFPRALNRPDVAGALQWSSDLATWRGGGESDGVRTVTFTEAVVSAPGADPETVEATATITGDSSRIFVRLRVE